MPNVLVVDDNESVRLTLSYWLEQHDYHVVEAVDGAAALRMAEQMEFDFAVIDIGLPQMNGIEVCRRLIAKHLSPKPLGVWLMTGVLTAGVEAAALAAGARAVLPKPFDPIQLMADFQAI